MLVDPYGRKITYLRISVTDRCNFRCIYCMPPGGISWQPHEEILRYEEIAAVVRVAVEQGIRSVRITGGEPLVRPGLPALVKMLADIPGLEDISLTTNATLLDRLAAPLAQAGLKRINVSLDTLKPERFARITRGGSLERAMQGIEAAEQAGLKPIKINAVLMRGINDDELLDLANLVKERAWDVRFIELMPLQDETTWQGDWGEMKDAFFSITEALEKLKSLDLEEVKSKTGLGPAREYRFKDSAGTLGFISPLSERHFCQQCNRMRLTADGCLRPCLMSDLEVPLRESIRTGEPVLPLLQKAVALKPEAHPLQDEIHLHERWMAQIGG